MAITLNSSGGFVPTTIIGTGEKGLHAALNSNSNATLYGSGLMNGLTVTVLFPDQSPNPHFRWTGVTSGANSAGTSCAVQLTQVGAGSEAAKAKPAKQNERRTPDLPQDAGSTVSVTATDTTTSTTSNTITPTVPLGS